jgi:hypothetical protein
VRDILDIASSGSGLQHSFAGGCLRKHSGIKIPQNPAGANEANYSSQPDKDRVFRQHLWTVTQQVAAELLLWGRVAQRGHRVAGPILLLFW